MEEAGVDGVLIVQPIFHKFDHSYVTRFVSHFPQFMQEILKWQLVSMEDVVVIYDLSI